jgi:hypothetical protein
MYRIHGMLGEMGLSEEDLRDEENWGRKTTGKT